MSQIRDGLLNDGNTGHFSISYESSMSPADGRTVAQGLMNFVEDDLALIREWFAGTTFKYSFPITVELHNASGGANWPIPPDIAAPTFHPTVLVKAVGSANKFEQGLDFVRYLIVSEVTEMYTHSKNNGWSENDTLFTAGDEGSKGEGLSRFLGRQFMLAKNIAGPFKDGDVVYRWLTLPVRPNYLDSSPDDWQPDPVTGGITAFLYYLHDQLGFSIPSIINAGSSSLTEVYQKLTGRKDAWDAFIGLVNNHYPAVGAQTDVRNDGIFPVPNLSSLGGGVSIVAGQSGQLYLSLDRVTPVTITVKLASDNPSILQTPPTVTVVQGHQDCVVQITALPVAGDPPLVTVSATYANATVHTTVRVIPHTSVLGGVVRDSATGAPIAGAVVVLDGETGRTSPSHVHGQFLTGPDGKWSTGEIRPDTYDLEVTAPGYMPATGSTEVTEGEPSTVRDFALIVTKPFVVQGIVRNQSGAPLPGVAITFLDDASLRLVITTAKDGSYFFIHKPNSYAGGYTLYAELAGYTPFELRIPTIGNGATVAQDVTLTALGVVTGLITAANGAAPVAGARVKIGAEAVTSDATGRYSLQLAPGHVSLNVVALGYEYAASSVTVAPGGTAEQDFKLVEASATLTGTVLDTDTEFGVRDASIEFDGAGVVRAGYDGTYTFSRVPAGPGQVVVRAQGYGVDTIPVQLTAHNTVSMNIYLKKSNSHIIAK